MISGSRLQEGVLSRRLRARADRPNSEIARFIAKTARASSWQLDAELRFVSTEAHMPTPFRTESSELRGKRLADVLASDARSTQILAAHAEALNGRSSTYSYERDGLVFEGRVEPLHSPEGAIVGVIGAALDVSDKHELERALHASRRELATTQAFAHLGNSERDLAGNEICWSEELYRIVGIPADPSGAAPRPFISFVLEDDVAALWEALEASRQAGTPFVLEHRIRRAGGEVRWVRTMSDGPRDGARTVLTTMDITDVNFYEERSRRHASVDPLTGFANRHGFEAELARLLAARADGDPPLLVAFLDLDGFKAVNDTLGHASGDAVLIEVARRLRCVEDRVVLFARFGDEFVLVAPQLAGELAVHQLAVDIIASFAAPFDVHGHERAINATIGICRSPDDGSDVTTLLRGAENALSRVKSLGAGYYTLLPPEVRSVAMRRRDIEAQLRIALAERHFDLHYQPIVDAETGSLVAAEALIRWYHPQRGLIAPNDFIEIAEASGQIFDIGAWVLQVATAACRAWQTIAGSPVRVAVNVSAKQLTHPEFVTRVLSALQQAELPPTLLELEITETAAMVDVEYVIGVLGRLRAHGVRFSIDDFGTGYSSLSFLKRLPVDTIKIDRSFISNIETDDGDRALAEAIIFVAHRSGLTVVGEGVENEKQHRILRSFGCDHIQGYHISKAQPLGDFRERLRNERCVTATTVLRRAV